MFVSAYTDYPEEAALFAEFLVSDEMQKLRYEITAALPSVDMKLDDPIALGFLKQLDYAYPMRTFAGYPLKEAVCAHLREKGWKITDLGVTDPTVEDTENMFHRVGLRVGAQISEGNFERALLFCGTGMGIHIAASKCPRVHAGVVESVPAALRAITGNGVNVLAMGAFYVAPAMGCDIADAYLNAELGSGYEWWYNFYEFHKLAMDELDAFDYEAYKANGFKMEHLGDFPLKLEKKPE